jgi:hypothetical protein
VGGQPKTPIVLSIVYGVNRPLACTNKSVPMFVGGLASNLMILLFFRVYNQLYFLSLVLYDVFPHVYYYCTHLWIP